MTQISRPFSMKLSLLIAQVSFRTASKQTIAEDQLVRTLNTNIIILIKRMSKKRRKKSLRLKTWRALKSSLKMISNLLFNKHLSLRTSLLKNRKFKSRKKIMKLIQKRKKLNKKRKLHSLRELKSLNRKMIKMMTGTSMM